MSIVNILFISDLHFTERLRSELEDCSKRYIAALSSLKDRPAIVAICGDIGYEGKKEDYELFKLAFFQPLITSLDIAPDHVIAVPGNHDKLDSHVATRLSRRIYWKELEDAVKSTYNLDDEESDKEFRETIGMPRLREGLRRERFVLDQYMIRPFKNYIDFLKRVGIPPFEIDLFTPQVSDNRDENSVKVDAAYLFGYRKVDDIDFYCFNSAWDCFHQYGRDKEYLRIGPVPGNLSEPNDSKVSISMKHHPMSWLSKEEISGMYYKAYYTVRDYDIIVNGHMHKSSVHRDELGNKIFIELPTWSSTDTDLSRWESFIVRVDTDTAEYSTTRLCWRRIDEEVPKIAQLQGDAGQIVNLKKAYEKGIEEHQAFERDILLLIMEQLKKLNDVPSIEVWSIIRELLKIVKDHDKDKNYFKNFIDDAEKYINSESLESEAVKDLQQGLEKTLRLT